MSKEELHELRNIQRILSQINSNISSLKHDLLNAINNVNVNINNSTNVLLNAINDVNRTINDSTNAINENINRSVVTIISESILKEYASAYSKIITSRLQLNILRRRYEEVMQRYYNNYKNIIIDYLRNIHDFLNQFINMSEQEFSILKKLLRLAKVAEDIHNEVKPDWINKELIEVVLDSNIKKRLNDLSNFTDRLREIHGKLTEAENLINNIDDLLKRMQLPIDIDDDVVVYVPVTIVEVEVNGNSRSYALKPSELNSEVLDSLVERAYDVKNDYPWKINEEDIGNILSRLKSIAENDDERELINKVKVLQVS